MKKMKITLAIGVVIILTAGVFLLFCCGVTTNNDISYYPTKNKEMKEYMQKLMPDLSTLGDYEKIYFREKTTDNIFVSHAETLMVKYNSAKYEEAKKNVEKAYSFFKNPVRLTDSGFCLYQIPAVQFRVNNFKFRVVDATNKTEDFNVDGLIISMIAMSDQEHTIVYLVGVNRDMTYIGDDTAPDTQAMIDYIGYQFGFNPFWEKQ